MKPFGANVTETLQPDGFHLLPSHNTVSHFKNTPLQVKVLHLNQIKSLDVSPFFIFYCRLENGLGPRVMTAWTDSPPWCQMIG